MKTNELQKRIYSLFQTHCYLLQQKSVRVFGEQKMNIELQQSKRHHT